MSKIDFDSQIVHVVNRGVRGTPIVQDRSDKYRFLELLYYLNDSNQIQNWEREVRTIGTGLHFRRPSSWPDRKPLIDVLSYCLMPNHFHLLLRELQERGVEQFMHRLGTSMARHFNTKYKEKGRLFQGSYKAKKIENEGGLLYTSIYINVKNPFELFPGGFEASIQNFNDAFQFASKYQFCSLADIIGERRSKVLSATDEIFFHTPEQYKKDAQDLLMGRLEVLNARAVVLE